MKDLMHYKGYYGSIHYNEEEAIFYGKVEFVRALISYESSTAKKFRKAFEEAVDDYLDLCQTEETEPEKPFKGSFNVRVGQELHRQLVLNAEHKGISLNQLVKEALLQATA